MDPFQRKVLQTLVRGYGNLSELEKQTGLEDRAVATALSSDLGIEPSAVQEPGYQSSEACLRVLNALQYLEEVGLVRRRPTIPFGWASPTPAGHDVVKTWAEEESSPTFQGKRVVKYLYEHQGDHSLVHRREGLAGGVDVGELCKELSIDLQTYKRAVGWAIRQGYADELNFNQATVEGGEIYITDEGMNAVDSAFRTELPASGPTINIHDSQVYGNILAAGRDAMTITSPEISASAVEIRQLLGEIQEAIDTLGEDDDVRHDALQEIDSLQREFSKESPAPGRIERSLGAIGSFASISALVGSQLARLLELAQQLPGL